MEHDELIELTDGYIARVYFEHDERSDAPWEESDGHGPVSEWTTRAKRPGERVLAEDRRQRRYYDFAKAITWARHDGWGPAIDGETQGQTAARAVERDYQYLRAWCRDDWAYLFVRIELINSEGAVVADDAVGGVESFKDYHRTFASELAHDLLSAELAERNEAHYWMLRGVPTESGAHRGE